MINSYAIIGLVLIALLVQGCNAVPVAPRTAAQEPQTVAKPVSSTSSDDSQYIGLLQVLLQRNAAVEAQEAIARGDRSLMGYYAGRGGLKFPGLTQQQQAAQRCTLKTLDGLGDVIYGENHLKYRVALRRFAKTYNSTMKSVCL